MVVSDDVSDDESTDDETESGGDYAERREGGDTESAEDAAWDDYRCNGVDTTDGCFFGNDKTKCGKVKSSTHIRRGWQNILKKLPRGNWPTKVRRYAVRNGIVSLDKILYNIAQHSNQCVLIIQPNFSR